MQFTVIGAASVDIVVKSKHEIVADRANNADVTLRAGGTARNIASMLADRKADVHLITAVGNDSLAVLLKDSCTELGINTDAWIIKNHLCTCVNLETQDNHGARHEKYHAMAAPEAIRTSDIIKHRELIAAADLLVMDLNLTEKIISTALDLRGEKPVLVDAVSADKAKRIEKFLDKVSILKLNRRQAESLTGITLDSKERVRFACSTLVDKGVGRVFCTLGVAGVCACDEHSTAFVPAQPVAATDSSGAGAAFVTGLALGLELDLRSQAAQGAAYAAEHLVEYAKIQKKKERGVRAHG